MSAQPGRAGSLMATKASAGGAAPASVTALADLPRMFFDRSVTDWSLFSGFQNLREQADSPKEPVLCISALVQARLPVRRYLSHGPRRRLALWVPSRFSEFAAFDHLSRPKIVEPRLARFKTRNHRVACRLKVLRRMLARRTVAASDVSAFDAATQMQPPTTRGEAFDTAITGRWNRGVFLCRFHVLPPPGQALCPNATRVVP
jgi:hypothetical protein